MSFHIAQFLLRKRSDEAESCCRTCEGIRKAVTGRAALQTIKVPSSRMIPLGFLSLGESKWLRHETRRMRKTPHLSRLFQNTHYILIRAKPQLLPQLPLFILPGPSLRAIQCFLRPLWKPLLVLFGWLHFFCRRALIYVYHEQRRMLPIATSRLGNKAETDCSQSAGSDGIQVFVLKDFLIASFFLIRCIDVQALNTACLNWIDIGYRSGLLQLVQCYYIYLIPAEFLILIYIYRVFQMYNKTLESSSGSNPLIQIYSF